jgi:His/Glu/Gln/Arg/opine family amino acid ABC transporter permease subunit
MEDERGPGLLEAIKEFSENASPVDFVIIAQHWEMFLTGIGYTLLIVVVSLVVGGALSLPLAVARAYRTPITSQIIWGYVYLFRGTPLLVQLYLIYYGSGQFRGELEAVGLWWIFKEPLWCTLIAFVLNTAAYTTEIFRGAIEAIPYGEVEAAKACGMSNWLRTTRIVLPNALRRALPAYSNEIIFMVHGSVVASTVTIVDILGAGRILNAKYYLAYEGFLAAAALYMILVLFITRGFKLWEKHWHAHLRPREA